MFGGRGIGLQVMNHRLRTAPAVAFKSGRTPLLAGILSLLWGAGAAASVIAMAHGELHLAAIVFLLLLLAASAVAIHLFWRHQTPRVLAWDGGRWLLTRPGRVPDARRDAVQLEVALDLQRALLLCCRGAGTSVRRCWLWLQHDGDPQRWHALRCALCAVAPDD